MSEQQQTILAMHTQAIELYRQQQWTDAEKIFVKLAQRYPEQLINTLYLKRIESFKQTPPENPWDGVFTHTSK